VRANRIFSNGGMGIDLFGDGVSTSRVPTVLHARRNGATTEVDGLFNFPGFFGRTFEIDLFASDACDPSGAGEGQSYLGTITVETTDNQAFGSFNATNLPAVPEGAVVTVTATQIISNSTALASTSELSACVSVTGP